MRKVLTASAGALAVLATIACGLGTNPDGDGAKVVEDPENKAAAPADDDTTEAAAGTRQNPLEPGVSFTVGDWVVALGETTPDAGEIIAAENVFNDPPAEGRQFVMVEVSVTYTGEKSGRPWLDLSFAFYGADGNTFGSSLSLDDYCGVIPNDLMDVGEMFPDASATGNVCVSVPAEQIDGGAWIVEEAFSLDSDRTFVAATS